MKMMFGFSAETEPRLRAEKRKAAR
jgi:hypothetical protein